MHADDVPDLKDFGMVLQLLTEDGAADLLVGLISNLQAGAEVCGKKTSCGEELRTENALRRAAAYFVDSDEARKAKL